MPAPREPQYKNEQRGLFTRPDTPTLITGAFYSYNLAFLPWLRKGQGIKAYRLGIFTLAIIFFYAGVTDSPEMLWYMPVWLVMVLLRRPDRSQPSNFMGYSIFRRLMRSQLRARFFELIVIGGIGLSVAQDYPAIGQFMIIGCISMGAVLGVEIGDINRRKRIMQDAEADAGYMQRLRNGENGFD